MNRVDQRMAFLAKERTIGLAPVGILHDINRGEWIPIRQDWTAKCPLPKVWSIFEDTNGENTCQLS